jgi:voltage-gated potassium channel
MTAPSDPTERPSSKPLPGRPRAPINRASNRFMSDPSSTRKAIVFIVVADVTIVLAGGTLIWLLDRQEYEHLGEALWYTLQTITTVGYGDVTPVEPIGRLVGAAIMMLGIAFLSILTASITSAFLDARQAQRRAEQDASQQDDQARLEARLDEVIARLDRIESAANRRTDAGGT